MLSDKGEEVGWNNQATVKIISKSMDASKKVIKRVMKKGITNEIVSNKLR